MRIEPTPKVLPPAAPDSFDWAAIVPHAIHPLKVAIIEALTWIEQPLSPTQMAGLFDDSKYYLSLVSFHAKGLEKWGAIETVETRQVRGAQEKFFFFSASPRVGGHA